jgi:hypothetical protein
MDQNDYVKGDPDVISVFGLKKVVHSNECIKSQEEINYCEYHERPHDDFEEHRRILFLRLIF